MFFLFFLSFLSLCVLLPYSETVVQHYHDFNDELAFLISVCIFYTHLFLFLY